MGPNNSDSIFIAIGRAMDLTKSDVEVIVDSSIQTAAYFAHILRKVHSNLTKIKKGMETQGDSYGTVESVWLIIYDAYSRYRDFKSFL